RGMSNEATKSMASRPLPQQPRHRPTIRDVAAAAMCSPSTVSRVLNGVGRSSQETKERVWAAARDLGFRFDPIGRSLQSRKSRTIGVLTPTLSNPVFADATGGVQAEAHARGYQVLLACSNYDPEAEEATVANLIAHRVDGLVLTVSDAADSAALELVLNAGVPFVLVFNHPRHAFPAVAFDNRGAATRMAEEMIALGHSHAAFVAGLFRSSDRATQRYEGFCDAYTAAGLPTPPLLEVDYRSPSVAAPLAGLLAKRPETTGLFCSNDMLAITVIGDLRRLGREVPRDMSVTGFDGIAVGNVVSPSIATIATACSAMGRSAAARLIDVTEGEAEPADTTDLLTYTFRPGTSLAEAPAVPRATPSAGPGAATPGPASPPETP
ncbi:MAG: LacI family DNA-binding transcriptional regulator, partial [Pseudomonadota bacterium]